jgi:hypothetical protein
LETEAYTKIPCNVYNVSADIYFASNENEASIMIRHDELQKSYPSMLWFLVNYVSFRLYCQKIDVIECKG